MLLAVEIGNSNIDAGLFDGPALVAVTCLPTHDPGADEALATWLAELPAPTSLAVVGGVVPAAVEQCAAVCRRLGLGTTIVGRDRPVPIEVRYDRPESVGIDRLLDALAAREVYGAPVLVADLGTATTVDLVDAGGAFVGGAILCGLRLAAQALAGRTALLPESDLGVPEQAVGRSTSECLRSGLVFGHAAAIAGLAARMRREAGVEQAPLIGTGGLAGLVAAAEPGLFDAVEPHLPLLGLRLAHEIRQGELTR